MGLVKTEKELTEETRARRAKHDLKNTPYYLWNNAVPFMTQSRKGYFRTPTQVRETRKHWTAWWARAWWTAWLIADPWQTSTAMILFRVEPVWGCTASLVWTCQMQAVSGEANPTLGLLTSRTLLTRCYLLHSYKFSWWLYSEVGILPQQHDRHVH